MHNVFFIFVWLFVCLIKVVLTWFSLFELFPVLFLLSLSLFEVFPVLFLSSLVSSKIIIHLISQIFNEQASHGSSKQMYSIIRNRNTRPTWKKIRYKTKERKVNKKYINSESYEKKYYIRKKSVGIKYVQCVVHTYTLRNCVT